MANWIRLSSTGGTGNTNITITASSNTNSATDRSQSFKVTAGNKIVNFIVVQDDDYKEIHTNPSVVSITGDNTANVDVITDFAWTASTTDTGVTLSQNTGSGNTTINVSYTNYTRSQLVKTATVTFSTVNHSFVMTIQHTLSGPYITVYYNILRTGSTYIAFTEGTNEFPLEPFMSVDGGPWIATQTHYDFETTGTHYINFMGAKRPPGQSGEYYTVQSRLFSYLADGEGAITDDDYTRIQEIIIGEGFVIVEAQLTDNPYVQTITFPSTLFALQSGAIWFAASLTRINMYARTQPPLKNHEWWANYYEQTGGPTVFSSLEPFTSLPTPGVLHYPAGSNYSEMLSDHITDGGMNWYQLGHFGWTGVGNL